MVNIMVNQQNIRNSASDTHAESADASAAVPRTIPELQQIRNWLAADCPVAPIIPAVPIALPRTRLEQMMIDVFRETIGEKSPDGAHQESQPALNWQPTPNSVSFRAGYWTKALKKWATNGLTEPDSVGTVVHELAKWLYWVELFAIPADERKARIKMLLTSFVQTKHMSFSTRINAGDMKDVELQVLRCIESAIRLQHNDKDKSKRIFSEIRNNLKEGRYKYPLSIVSILESKEQPQVNITSFSASSFFLSIYLLCIRFIPKTIPKMITDRIAKYAGRRKVFPFAAKLMSYLYEKGGSASVGREALFVMLGYRNSTQLSQYLRVLEEAEVISRGDSYKVGRNGKSCSLSSWVMEALNRTESH